MWRVFYHCATAGKKLADGKHSSLSAWSVIDEEKNFCNTEPRKYWPIVVNQVYVPAKVSLIFNFLTASMAPQHLAQ
jgi:hypothetical protein